MKIDLSKMFIDKPQNYLIEFQNRVLDIVFNFMSVDSTSYDKQVDKLLESIGTFFDVDRIYLFTIDDEYQTMTYSHEWCDTGVEPLIDTDAALGLLLESYPWWMEQLDRHGLVHVQDVSSMPPEASEEQKRLQKNDVKSIVSVAIKVKNKIVAYIGIDSVESTKKWTEEQIHLIHLMADILAKGIAQMNYAKEVNFLAYHDPLTELPNRVLLIKKLTEEIHIANQENTLIGLLFINVDEFKRINDTLGYLQGNELLKQIAQRIVQIDDQGSIVFRTDGDQFVICIKDYKEEANLDQLASQVVAVFKKPFILRGEQYMITASIGIARYPKDGNEPEELIRNAYMAMNKAKSLGKNQYQKSTLELQETVLETASLTNDLYRAIELDELLLHYQPQICNQTGEIVGVEALLRWHHPKYGFVPPFKFIPLAEESRLIIPIGLWVLETASNQWKLWQEKGYTPVRIAVNFSVHQLSHPRIINQIKKVLETTGIPPYYLEIEITESVAMGANTDMIDVLEEVKTLGVSLSIDDFGKEYSSLSRLKDSPVDRLKVDMSFVQGIGVNKKDEIIVRAIVLLADELDLETIAEGVETEEQLEFLKETACDELQGYYFHKPMPADELEQLLQPIDSTHSKNE